ncbi:MAG: Ig-like domain-containing protein [Gemmatimonadetes bacterium]|nr:Ig-like domain-containing protein [Gemmatimonadota bacterium]
MTPATSELTALGATVKLSVEVADQNGQVMTGAAVTWSSSAAGVATINASGLVTAAGNGTGVDSQLLPEQRAGWQAWWLRKR